MRALENQGDDGQCLLRGRHRARRSPASSSRSSVERLGWSPPRSAGPYSLGLVFMPHWAFAARTRRRSSAEGRRAHSRCAEPKTTWRTSPSLTREQGMAELAALVQRTEASPMSHSASDEALDAAKPSPRRGSPRPSGEVPVGVHHRARGPRSSAEAATQRETSQDPTTHAEMIAIREAANALGSWRLIDTTLYVTLEPCPMCAGALVNARVPRVVWGCNDPKAGATETLYTIGSDAAPEPPFRVRAGRPRRRMQRTSDRVFRGDPCQRQPPETALTPQGVLLASAAESCPSGRRCLIRNQVYRQVPRVRIPCSPPSSLTTS